MYYSARLGWWRDNSAQEFELVHHKLTLVNNAQEVEYFSITHRFNLLTVSRACKEPYFIWSLSAGAAISYSERYSQRQDV